MTAQGFLDAYRVSGGTSDGWAVTTLTCKRCGATVLMTHEADATDVDLGVLVAAAWRHQAEADHSASEPR
jgi:hypothetical protein